MKKIGGIIVTVCFFLLSINLISGLDLNLKSTYYPGETLQLEIPDAFLTNLQLVNIGIYKGASVHVTPVESANLLKLDNKYYYYAILPAEIGEYSLKIENIYHWEGASQTDAPILKSFSIVSTNSSYLSFDPGYIYTSKDFSIVIKAYNANQDVNVEFAPTDFKQTFNLGYTKTKTVFIPITGVENITKADIKINSYSIPVAIIGKPIQRNETVNITYTIEDLMDIKTDKINATILADRDYPFEIIIVSYDLPVKNIKIATSNNEIRVSPTLIEELYGGRIINVTINSKNDLSGFINLSIENSSVKIPVYVYITKNSSQVNSNIPIATEEKTCSQYSGAKCDESSGERCSGSETYVSDGLCCLGECIASPSSSGWLWGVLIFIILGAGGWFLYNKYNKTSGTSSRRLFQRKAEDFEKRINPEIPGVEVRRSLSKQ